MSKTFNAFCQAVKEVCPRNLKSLSKSSELLRLKDGNPDYPKIIGYIAEKIGATTTDVKAAVDQATFRFKKLSASPEKSDHQLNINDALLILAGLDSIKRKYRIPRHIAQRQMSECYHAADRHRLMVRIRLAKRMGHKSGAKNEWN